MFFLLISLAVSAPAAESTPSRTTAETTPAPGKRDKPKLICRRINYTGSRLPERECRTQEQWDHRADETGKWMKQDKSG